MVTIHDIFGQVNKGIHSYRICNIAIMDVIMTVVGAYLIHRYILSSYKFYQVLTGLFIMGIILHRLLGVRTTVDKLLFKP